MKFREVIDAHVGNMTNVFVTLMTKKLTISWSNAGIRFSHDLGAQMVHKLMTFCNLTDKEYKIIRNLVTITGLSIIHE